MAVSSSHPVHLELQADRHMARWRPLVHWFLAIPQIFVVSVLSTLRNVLTIVSLFAILVKRQIPRPLFDAIAMIYRYEWRTFSYVLFLHDGYPPFDFRPAAEDDGTEPHTTLSFAYPEELGRWKPLYKWLIALPHYVVMCALILASLIVILFAAVAVVFTGEYPMGARDFLINVARYGQRVQSYVGLLNDRYPPFALHES
ncbi:MAG: DUF4389 domain-containing protein [Acidimicrobiales bacterium]